ncbi:MAG TPA: formate dehydrogenase subunit delta [Methylotenera sp.]|nr:formate dehydrogenase subunit delta [Methylotenera sp.]
MQIEHLVTMANQIGDFFKFFPDQAQAKKDIAQHLSRFWAKNMRKQILAHTLDKNGDGLEAIVSDAIKEHLNNKDAKLQLTETATQYLGQ